MLGRLVLAAIVGGCVVSGGAQAQPTGVGVIEVTRQLIDVSGNGHRRTFPCEGRHVVIAGSDHVITLTGVCASLDVSGANNAVTATLAPGAALTVAGSEHRVNWRSSGDPRQDFSGVENTIRRLPNP